MASGRLRRDSNGAQWRRVRAAVLRSQTLCALCGGMVDKGLRTPHPGSPEIDHIVPISKGGHPTALGNLQLTHRACNRAKWDGRREVNPTSRTW